MAGVVVNVNQLQNWAQGLQGNDFFPASGPGALSLHLLAGPLTGLTFDSELSLFSPGVILFPGGDDQIMQSGGEPVPTFSQNGAVITIQWPDFIWIETTTPTSVQITGYVVFNEDPDWVWFEAFAVPFDVNNPGDFVQFGPQLTIFGQNVVPD
jgi:hypothetical protein